jgi:hypothetical protein
MRTYAAASAAIITAIILQQVESAEFYDRSDANLYEVLRRAFEKLIAAVVLMNSSCSLGLLFWARFVIVQRQSCR